jgi:hypothetical protein
MEEKGFVARDCLPPEPRCPRQGTSASEAGSGQRQGGGFSRQRAAGLRRETIPGNNLSSISLFELDFSESKASIKKHAMGPLMT